MRADKLKIGRVYLVATESIPNPPETLFSYYSLEYLGRIGEMYKFGDGLGEGDYLLTREQVEALERLRWVEE
jgi:hypothetical protein